MQTLSNKSIKQIEQYQQIELQNLLLYLSKHSFFYQQLFRNNQININNFKLSGLSLIPPTTKNDLQSKNWDFLCVAKNKIAEYFSTSGTLGLPVTIALTENDLKRLAYNEYLSFVQAECTEKDIFQLMLTMDRQFMAGMAYYTGIQKLGAAAIRVGAGNLPLQIDSILRNQPTVIIAVPSFILKLIEYAKANAIKLNDTSVKKAICIGESIRNTDFTLNELSKRILNEWNIKLYSTYASTEKQTAFTECSIGQGSHVHPDLLIFEILDDNDQPLPPGQYGELTITTLGVEGMPLLRYKTGDICTYFSEPCGCGSNTPRLSQIVGRKQQLIKLKGTTLYPATIFNILNSIEAVNDYFIEVTTNEINTDDLYIYISLKEAQENILQSIRQKIQVSLRVLPEISILPNEEVLYLQATISDRKLHKFHDKRISQKP